MAGAAVVLLVLELESEPPEDEESPDLLVEVFVVSPVELADELVEVLADEPVDELAEESVEAAADAVGMIAAGDANPVNTELQADGTPRRRRGRRGGRRRRRPEGEAAGTLDAANDQSEMDFEDADDVAFDLAPAESSGNDAPVTVETEKRELAPASPRPAPVVVSAIPVSTAESDFTDLEPITEIAPAAPVQESSQTEALAVPAAAPVPPPLPPSFSMPNAPSSGFDFTVRISPESKED